MYTLFVNINLALCVSVLGPWVLVSVRIFHPSATACQDVSSFVRWPFMYTLFVNINLALCVSVLGPCVCQDVSSFGNTFGNSLSRCIIFRQVARTLFVNINLALCVSRRVCVLLY